MAMSQEMQVLTSYESEEWYTPSWIIGLARELMGSIDLDPASAELPQQWIQAGTYYTENGLEKPWFGNVWLNPPYGKTGNKSNMEVWTQHAIYQYETNAIYSALILINSTHGYKWYEQVWTSFPCVLLRDRISFINSAGKTVGKAKRGQTLIYLGTQLDNFRAIFAPYGRVLFPER